MNKNNNLNDKKFDKSKKNATQYGEFISSYFGWLPIDRQKERADEIDKMTKNKEDS